LAHFQVAMTAAIANMPHYGTVTVYYHTEDGSAHAPVDYAPTYGDKSLTFTYDSSTGGYDPQCIAVDTNAGVHVGTFSVVITHTYDPCASTSDPTTATATVATQGAMKLWRDAHAPTLPRLYGLNADIWAEITLASGQTITVRDTFSKNLAKWLEGKTIDMLVDLLKKKVVDALDLNWAQDLYSQVKSAMALTEAKLAITKIEFKAQNLTATYDYETLGTPHWWNTDASWSSWQSQTTVRSGPVTLATWDGLVSPFSVPGAKELAAIGGQMAQQAAAQLKVEFSSMPAELLNQLQNAGWLIRWYPSVQPSDDD
jgi:hypothetical protein